LSMTSLTFSVLRAPHFFGFFSLVICRVLR
jgi:hypothetical protein